MNRRGGPRRRLQLRRGVLTVEAILVISILLLATIASPFVLRHRLFP